MGRIKTLCGEWSCRHEFEPEASVATVTHHGTEMHAGGQPILRLAVKCPNCDDEWMRMIAAVNVAPTPRQTFYCDACTTSLELKAGS